MTKPFARASVAAAAVAFLLASASPGGAAVIPGWYSSTDLSAVIASGNSDTINVGATVNLRKQGLRSAWNTTASFNRNDVREPQRFGILVGNNVSVDKGEWLSKSEKLFANSAYEYRITERFFWNIGATGERDKFAGLNSRLSGFAGVGFLWQNTEGSGLVRLGINGTYTAQNEVIDDPETENQFAGARGVLDVERRFGDGRQHAFVSNLIVDQNIQDTDDLRANWQTSLAAAISQRLQLKVGAQVAFDNAPQLIDLPVQVFDVATGVFREATNEELAFVVPGGDIRLLEGKVATPAKKVDATFSVSLVINFAPGGRAGRPTP